MKTISSKIIQNIRRDLKANIDKKYKEDVMRFFKEKVTSYGVPTSLVHEIAKRYFKDVEILDRKDIFILAEELLKSDYNEEATIATQWIFKIKDRLKKIDFYIFERWLEKYINNWGEDDGFCTHIVYPLIEKYPTLIKKVKLWAKSKNQWVRRASAVSFIKTFGSEHATKHNLEDIFDIAITLMYDKEDLVQKGYGWMLKSASVYHQKEVFNFIMAHKKGMPRTALRYAIEKMPDHLRKQAMD